MPARFSSWSSGGVRARPFVLRIGFSFRAFTRRTISTISGCASGSHAARNRHRVELPESLEDVHFGIDLVQRLVAPEFCNN